MNTNFIKVITIYTFSILLLISCSNNQKKIEYKKTENTTSLKFLEWPEDSLIMDEISLKNFKNSGTIQNGLKEGIWTEYFVDSTLKLEEISYSFGNKKFTLPPEDLILKQIGSYTKGKRNGKWNIYKLRKIPSLQWDMFSVINFYNNLKNGEEIIYQGFEKDLTPYLIRNWRNGIENGKGKLYDINFPYSIRKLYTAINGKLYINETYYVDGSIESKFTDTILLGKSLKFHKQYYANRHIKCTEFYKDTLLEGKYTYYHDNGKLWTERIYKEGKLLEVLNNFDRFGKKGNPGTIKNGNGIVYFYGENGSITNSIEYVNGIPKNY